MSNNRLEKLLEMLNLQPDDAFLIYAVGFEYEALGDFASAQQYYNSVLDKAPDYLPVYYQAGLLQFKMGNIDRAITLLNQGINLAMEKKDQKTLRELRQALEEVEDFE